MSQLDARVQGSGKAFSMHGMQVGAQQQASVQKICACDSCGCSGGCVASPLEAPCFQWFQLSSKS
eukprot:scaffold195134_cov21-Tisochrysis_lutea.AAC.1